MIRLFGAGVETGERPDGTVVKAYLPGWEEACENQTQMEDWAAGWEKQLQPLGMLPDSGRPGQGRGAGR